MAVIITAAAAAAMKSASSQRFLPLSTSTINFNSKTQTLVHVPCLSRPSRPYVPLLTDHHRRRHHNQKRRQLLSAVISVATQDLTDVIPVNSNDYIDQQQLDGAGATAELDINEANGGGGGSSNQVTGFAFQSGGGSMGSAGGGGGGSIFPSNSSSLEGGEELNKMVDRAINTAIVLAASTFAITKLLTVDRDYWHVSDYRIPPPFLNFIVIITTATFFFYSFYNHQIITFHCNLSNPKLLLIHHKLHNKTNSTQISDGFAFTTEFEPWLRPVSLCLFIIIIFFFFSLRSCFF